MHSAIMRQHGVVALRTGAPGRGGEEESMSQGHAGTAHTCHRHICQANAADRQPAVTHAWRHTSPAELLFGIFCIAVIVLRSSTQLYWETR
jgi:hypothetical protein